MHKTMTIGQVAKALGVNVETIRYYQRRGLVEMPARPASGGFRRYTPATIARLNFIRRAQQLGFTLAEVERLIQLDFGTDTAAIRQMAERKQALLAGRIEQLGRMRADLGRLIAASLGKARARKLLEEFFSEGLDAED
jgi:MerR family mercuric resistance operon transcriptional regulator